MMKSLTPESRLEKGSSNYRTSAHQLFIKCFTKNSGFILLINIRKTYETSNLDLSTDAGRIFWAGPEYLLLTRKPGIVFKSPEFSKNFANCLHFMGIFVKICIKGK